MVRAIYSHKDEDGSSVCSEDNDDTYILDSEDDAFKVTKSVKDCNIHYHLNIKIIYCAPFPLEMIIDL